MGTPDFSCPALSSLVKEGFEVTGVFTQKDRPKGRGRVVHPPPVKKLAESLGLPVFQPETVDKVKIGGLWSELRPDVVIVVAYGHILPPWMLHSTPLGCVNLHASLLPSYRGAAPINWAIINGDKETGVTVMLMDEGVDTGPIFKQKNVAVMPDDTAQTLQERLSVIGADLMVETLKEYMDGRIAPHRQAEEGSSIAPKLDREIGRLDWNKDNHAIRNLIRGINPSPGAFTFLDDQMIKIWRAVPVMGDDSNPTPGMICGFDPVSGLIVQTGKGALGLEEIQPQSKNRMSSQAFLNGCKFDPVGKIFRRFPSSSN